MRRCYYKLLIANLPDFTQNVLPKTTPKTYKKKYPYELFETHSDSYHFIRLCQLGERMRAKFNLICEVSAICNRVKEMIEYKENIFAHY